jgi:cell wall-associated NlpC family hydrolase
VQQAFYACGLTCPRDSDMQMAQIGAELDGSDLRRGDLVFWKGHVGLMQDETRLLHANAHHMAVTSEPLMDAVQRIEAAGSGMPTAFRRP